MLLTVHSGFLPLGSQIISFLKELQKGGKWPVALCLPGASAVPLEGSLQRERWSLSDHRPRWHVKAARVLVSPPKQLGVSLQAPPSPQLPHLSLSGRISHTPALIVANRTISAGSRIS